MADPISIIDQALAAYRGDPVQMGSGGLFQFVYPGSGDTEYLVQAGLPVMDAISRIGPGTPRRPTSGATQPLPPRLVDLLNQNALTPDPRPPTTPAPGQYIPGLSPPPGVIPGGTQTQFPLPPGPTPPPSYFAAMHGTPFGSPGQPGYTPGPIDPVSGAPLGTVRGYPSPLPGHTPPWGSAVRPPHSSPGPPVPVGGEGSTLGALLQSVLAPLASSASPGGLQAANFYSSFAKPSPGFGGK